MSDLPCGLPHARVGGRSGRAERVRSEFGISHWGDADVGGLRIWWFLRCRLQRPVSLFRTTAAWIESEIPRAGLPLSSGLEVLRYYQQLLKRSCRLSVTTRLSVITHFSTLPLITDELPPLRPKRHVFACFFDEAPAVDGVADCLPYHAPNHTRPEVVFAVEASDCIHKFCVVQPGISDVWQ